MKTPRVHDMGEDEYMWYKAICPSPQLVFGGIYLSLTNTKIKLFLSKLH